MSVTRRRTLSIVTTVVSGVVAILGALEMRDHVRLVEIITLFFGGAGAGAGVTSLAVGGRTRAPEPSRKRQSELERD